MRIFKLIGVLVCAIAVSAIAVTTASASILPGAAKTSITGGSGKATLQVKSGASITCKESTASGEVLSSSAALATINFGTNCTTGGLPVESLGDASGTILVHVEVAECPSNAEVLELTVLPIHLEVPSTKLLLTIEGTALGTVLTNTKAEEFALTVTQKEGKNTVETCGKEKLILLTSTDGGTFTQSGEEAIKAFLKFGAPEEFM